MYTRCPECLTAFRITAAQLARAAGRVRCGACGADFDALLLLSEGVPPRPVAEPPPPPQTQPAPAEAPTPAPAPASGVAATFTDIDTLRFSDDGPLLEDTGNGWVVLDPKSLEEWHEPSPVLRAGAEPVADTDLDSREQDEDAGPPPAQGFEPLDDEALLALLSREANALLGADPTLRADTVWRPEPAVTWWPDDDEPMPAEALQDEPPPEATPVTAEAWAEIDEGTSEDSCPEAGMQALPVSALYDDAAAEPEIDEPTGEVVPAPEAVRQGERESLGENDRHGESESSDEPPAAVQALEETDRERGGRGWLAAGLALVLLLALAAQAVHQFRDSLAIHPVAGPWVMAAYARLDRPLHPAWPLADYELRARDDALLSADRQLEIHATLRNRGELSLPAPLIRLTLLDRWGESMGMRVFEPPEYLLRGAAMPLAPGGVIETTLTVRAPEGDLYGYRLDVCRRIDRDALYCDAQPR